MFNNSTACSAGQRPKAREVLLSWARARGYKDLASRYLKLAKFASDCNVRDRFVLIARHYATLAEAERHAADGTVLGNRQSQNMADYSFAGPFTSIALVLLLLMSVALTTVPLNSAQADDCLAAPNAPAPSGRHWYFHLNRATQQKCWYVRAFDTPAQHATAQASSRNGAALPIRGSKGAQTAAGTIAPEPRAKMSSVRPTPEPVPNTVQNQTADQSAPAETIAATPVGASQESTSTEPSVQVAAAPPPVWPDPPTTAAIKVQEANAETADVRVDLVSDDGSARSGEQAKNFGMPMIVFPVLALGLVVVGIGSRVVLKNAASHRACTVEGAETDATPGPTRPKRRADQYQSGFIQEEQELHSSISAVSDREPFEATSGANELLDDISLREAKLARLRDDIDRRLRRQEPTQLLLCRKQASVAEAVA